jgi:hypothetical protein
LRRRGRRSSGLREQREPERQGHGEGHLPQSTRLLAPPARPAARPKAAAVGATLLGCPVRAPCSRSPC